MFELSEKELERAVGGMLTAEAEEWIERNRQAVIDRAPSNLKSMADFALNIVKNNKKLYDVEGLKAELKNFGVNVDDLD